MAGWTFLTNHAHVLLCVARNPEARVRDVADAVGITERAAVRILADLAGDGYVSRRRVGRRNVYAVHGDRPFRHPLEQDHAVGELLDVLGPGERGADAPAASETGRTRATGGAAARRGAGTRPDSRTTASA